MSDIRDEGFLSQEAEDWSKKHCMEAAPYYTLAYEINRFSHSFFFGLKSAPDHPGQNPAMTLFGRSLTCFQAVILLAKVGMFSEIQVQLRVLIEIMFKLGALRQNEDFAEILHLKDLHFLRKRCRLYLEGKLEFDAGISAETMNRWIGQITDHLKKKSFRDGDWTVEKISSIARSADIYNTYYGAFSDAVHVTSGNLFASVEASDDPNMDHYHYGPSDENTPFFLYLSSTFHLVNLQTTGELFSFDFSSTDFFELQKKLFTTFGMQPPPLEQLPETPV